MAAILSCRCLILFGFLLQTITNVVGYQYKVGDLDAWGIPTSVYPQVYSKWPTYHTFKIGDSLLFLYPPSQDSVIQVTTQSFASCNTKNPILYMNNGNSLFNITECGEYFFTSGESGHCEKKQKMHVSVCSNGTAAYAPAEGPGGAVADSPSYPTNFGTILQPLSSSSTSLRRSYNFIAAFVLGSAIWATISIQK